MGVTGLRHRRQRNRFTSRCNRGALVELPPLLLLYLLLLLLLYDLIYFQHEKHINKTRAKSASSTLLNTNTEELSSNGGSGIEVVRFGNLRTEHISYTFNSTQNYC